MRTRNKGHENGEPTVTSGSILRQWARKDITEYWANEHENRNGFFEETRSSTDEDGASAEELPLLIPIQSHICSI